MTGIHENKLHGQVAFPFTVYRVKLPENIRAYPLHWHEEMELIAVTKGQGIITVQAERYEAHPGDILVIPPQMLHGIEQQGEHTMEYFNILFRLTMLDDGGQAGAGKYIRLFYDHTRRVPVFLKAGSELNSLLAEPVTALIENRKKKDSAYALMIRSHLYGILYHILEHSDGAAGFPSEMQTNYDKLKPALGYLREHYEETICIHSAAEMCGFSDSHFMKLFRELTGTSFAQYLKRLRLEAAAEALRGGRRVSEVAEMTGFHNLSYFTRAFRNQYGVTPSAYRERQ